MFKTSVDGKVPGIAGTAHNVADDDAGAIQLAHDYLSYFPQNRHSPAPLQSWP